MAEHYERLAADGDGDLWGYGNGGWRCLTNAGAADDDESLSGCCGPVVFYAPAPPPRAVAYDLSDTDTAHVLGTALRDYANQAEENARRDDAGESFARWAGVADRMRAQAEAAGQ